MALQAAENGNDELSQTYYAQAQALSQQQAAMGFGPSAPLQGMALAEADRASVLWQIDGWARRLDKLKRDQRRAVRDMIDAARPATGSSTRVINLETNRDALVRYHDFPLDREKRRLLESFR